MAVIVAVVISRFSHSRNQAAKAIARGWASAVMIAHPTLAVIPPGFRGRQDAAAQSGGLPEAPRGLQGSRKGQQIMAGCRFPSYAARGTTNRPCQNAYGAGRTPLSHWPALRSGPVRFEDSIFENGICDMPPSLSANQTRSVAVGWLDKQKTGRFGPNRAAQIVAAPECSVLDWELTN